VYFKCLYSYGIFTFYIGLHFVFLTMRNTSLGGLRVPRWPTHRKSSRIYESLTLVYLQCSDIVSAVMEVSRLPFQLGG
jgi:hypothetical protein